MYLIDVFLYVATKKGRLDNALNIYRVQCEVKKFPIIHKFFCARVYVI